MRRPDLRVVQRGASSHAAATTPRASFVNRSNIIASRAAGARRASCGPPASTRPARRRSAASSSPARARCRPAAPRATRAAAAATRPPPGPTAGSRLAVASASSVASFMCRHYIDKCDRSSTGVDASCGAARAGHTAGSANCAGEGGWDRPGGGWSCGSGRSGGSFVELLGHGSTRSTKLSARSGNAPQIAHASPPGGRSHRSRSLNAQFAGSVPPADRIHPAGRPRARGAADARGDSKRIRVATRDVRARRLPPGPRPRRVAARPCCASP